MPFRYVILITIVFFIFSTLLGLFIINKAIEPALMAYAENETKKVAATVIKNAINQQINEEALVQEELSIVQTDETGKVISYNTQIVNKMATETLGNIEKYLKYVNEGDIQKLEYPNLELEKDDATGQTGFVFKVPLGEASNNAILGNLGPEIPIRFHMVGFGETTPQGRIDEWGINNGWFQYNVLATVTMQVILPFSTGEVEIETIIPVINQNILHDVPEFYNNGSDSSPSIEIPTD
ncbi:sporulation protein YunB [Fredinandcohnia sp. QZ13]|uniref:sporulation protein YunB n=1 Tax=Fredinandcohnia sp. QZ13 TaxID=3073144 RepID=UPI0028530448|nr:sporulation protein YunB [Fredinandcohnia sp. QZ13]MDR4889434.1 sporulation protein YunB [Fredinandcohnia sp. QZ13]